MQKACKKFTKYKLGTHQSKDMFRNFFPDPLDPVKGGEAFFESVIIIIHTLSWRQIKTGMYCLARKTSNLFVFFEMYGRILSHFWFRLTCFSLYLSKTRKVECGYCLYRNEICKFGKSVSKCPLKTKKGLKKIWDANKNTIQNKYNFVLYFSDSMYYSPLKPKKLFKHQLVYVWPS